LLDSQGRLVNASRNFEADPNEIAHSAYFQAFLRNPVNSLYVSQPSVGQDSGWVLHLARPLFNKKGGLRGVVVAAIGLSAFEHLYSAMQLDYVRPVGFYLADRTRIASWPPQPAEVGKKAVELGADLPAPGRVSQSVRRSGDNDERRLTAVGHLTAYPILVSVTDDEYLSLNLWREVAWPIASGALLVSIFIALVALYLVGKLRLKQQLTLALTAADQRYQHTVNSVMDAIVAVDESMRVVLFNPSAEKMFGYEASAVIGRPLDMLLPERFRSIHLANVRSFMNSKLESRSSAPQTDIVGLRSDGAEFPLESTVSQSFIGGQLQMTAVLRDASERRRVEAELRLANGQLRELSASLQSVREEERKRISRELHDDLGQQLTGLKLSLSWLGSRLKGGKPTTVDDVDEMRHQMDAVIGSVRRLATELRPRVLDDVDFREAVVWHAEDFLSAAIFVLRWTCKMQIWSKMTRSPPHCFESCKRRSPTWSGTQTPPRSTSACAVSIGSLILAITDNGQGFSPGLTDRGVGLVSMRERCAGIGAQFAVLSEPMGGTRVEVTVPLTDTTEVPSGAKQ